MQYNNQISRTLEKFQVLIKIALSMQEELI